jgi:hypothetical protein
MKKIMILTLGCCLLLTNAFSQGRQTANEKRSETSTRGTSTVTRSNNNADREVKQPVDNRTQAQRKQSTERSYGESYSTRNNNYNRRPTHVITPKRPKTGYYEHPKPMPKYGHTTTKVPKYSNKIYHGNTYYYYNNGIYYRPYNNSYVVTRAPIGVRVGILPVGYRPVVINRTNYYYYYGTYYTKNNDYYEVIAPPVGAVVENIPTGYEKIEINGETYFIADGIQYKAIIINNEIWYQVIKVID